MWFSYHPSPLNQEGEFKGTIEMVKPQGKQPTFPTACDQYSLLREEDHKILVSQSGEPVDQGPCPSQLCLPEKKKENQVLTKP